MYIPAWEPRRWWRQECASIVTLHETGTTPHNLTCQMTSTQCQSPGTTIEPLFESLMPPAASRETAYGCAAAHTGLCAFESVRWHSREQYRTAWHRPHTLPASSDAHPAAAHPAFATHLALSDSSFPSSSAAAYRPARASNDSTRARLLLCSGLAISRCTSTRVPVGSGRAAPAGRLHWSRGAVKAAVGQANLKGQRHPFTLSASGSPLLHVQSTRLRPS
jgi:hypothetical protein